MKKKITHSVLFVAVLAGTTALTLFAGRGNLSSTIYNFVFLAVIAVLYLIAMFGGMFRMNNLSTAFHRAVEELNSMFKTPGKTDPRNLTYLGELFDDKYLDQKMDSFTDSINNSKKVLGILRNSLMKMSWISMFIRSFWKWFRISLPVLVF